MSGGEGPAPAWSRGERSETHVPSSATVGERRSLGYRQRSHVRCPVQGQVAGDEDGIGEGEGGEAQETPRGSGRQEPMGVRTVDSGGTVPSARQSHAAARAGDRVASQPTENGVGGREI